jgi:hypothetical protein
MENELPYSTLFQREKHKCNTLITKSQTSYLLKGSSCSILINQLSLEYPKKKRERESEREL